MDLGQQARYISDCFITLTDDEVEEVFDEWAEMKYKINGWNSALSDLTRLLQRKSLSEEQLAEEDRRLASME
jgi:hypothetical protein